MFYESKKISTKSGKNNTIFADQFSRKTKHIKMKKYLLSLLAFVIGVNMAIAGPIDNQLAQSFGEKFVQANFDL